MKVRKIVAGLAAVSMLAAFSAQTVFAAGVTIKAGEAQAKVGETGTLAISLEGVSAPINVADFAITYDASVITVTGVTAGAIVPGGVDAAETFDGVTAFTADTSAEGTATVLYSTGLADEQYAVTADGVLANVAFTVKEGAAAGTYPVTITAISRETTQGSGTKNADVKIGYLDADGNANKYDVTPVAGSIVVLADGEEPTSGEDPTTPSGSGDIVYGDVDLDGHVDVLDVLTLNKNLLGLEPLNEEQRSNADVDLNGTADATDSLNILKYVVKLITTLPV